MKNQIKIQQIKRNRKYYFVKWTNFVFYDSKHSLRALSEIFETGRKAKSDLVETEIAAKREYRSYENYA